MKKMGYRSYQTSSFCLKSIVIRLIILFSFSLAFLTACGLTSYEDNRTTPSPAVIMTAYASYKIGEIINVDGCIRIRDQHTNKSAAIVWTPDVSATIDGDQVRIITGIIRKETREFVFHFGDIVKIDGGESAFPDEELLQKLPPDCEGPYWIIGFSITPFQTTEEPKK
jgi:hypothetical protein